MGPTLTLYEENMLKNVHKQGEAGLKIGERGKERGPDHIL